jgi:hypothetical protein
MNISKRIASIAVAAVLSIAGLAAVTMVAGHDGRWGHSAWAYPGGGKHGDKQMCHRGHGGKYGSSGPHRRHGGPDRLAAKLSAIETEIGIRADQIDAWRDFTDALQAIMKRPMGPGGPGGPGMMAPGDNAEPFSLAERFADNAIARAKSAEDLKKAIAELRSTLTSEQLEKVKEIEARLRAKMARHHGWSKGPHGKGGHVMGPQGGPQGGPQAAPQGGPPQAAPADDGDDDSEE